ncbi:MAG TPA: gluconate 2-dehydrogenase subunit 3 family protein [Acidimicrobiales bacterium]|nr:gluconate 2-dehydrogenase subunit 3 family protein [Acidimicrobiales bacterium]
MPTAFTRRKFLAAAAAGGALAIVPGELGAAARAATATADQAEPGFYFFTPAEGATCAAICARVVPSTDPVTGAPVAGAAEARAVVFIDRLLSAFSLPAAVADNPAVYLRGPFSNRNPYPDYATGGPSGQFPADDFMSPDGQGHYVALDALQELSWRALIVGVDAALATAPPWMSARWASEVRSGLIPALGPPQGLQALYRSGLAAFDSYSETLFHEPFSQATPAQQDLMLEAAGNAVLGPLPAPSPPGAPPAAKALFPYVVDHTFEGSYGLPEYRGLDSNPLWAEIHWDGDTQPLGSSVYDETLYGPGEGPNAGFGEQGVFVPRGDYREVRPVSFLAPGGGPALTEGDVAPIVEVLQSQGLVAPLGGGK